VKVEMKAALAVWMELVHSKAEIVTVGQRLDSVDVGNFGYAFHVSLRREA
jgi:hypothetical protein